MTDAGELYLLLPASYSLPGRTEHTVVSLFPFPFRKQGVTFTRVLSALHVDSQDYADPRPLKRVRGRYDSSGAIVPTYVLRMDNITN